MSPSNTGAHSASGRRRPLGWLPWVLLLVLALVVALIVIVVANTDDDEEGAQSPLSPAGALVLTVQDA